MSKEEDIKINRFADQMKIELTNNSHKGSILDWHNFNHMISELEYHKSKMMMAITTNNKQAIKEYIADCGNIFLAIGNLFNLYESDSINTELASELNRDDLIRSVNITDQCTHRSQIIEP